MFRSAREGASFHSIASAAREVELMEKEEHGDVKRTRTSAQYPGTSSGGKDHIKGVVSFHRRGLVHAAMPTSQGGQTTHGFYSADQGSHGTQQLSAGRGSYTGSSGSSKHLFTPRSYYGCGDPIHLLWQCPMKTHAGPQHSYSTPARGPTRQQSLARQRWSGF